MAIVLGLIGFVENPAACLLIDGKLHSFCQEERLTRLKNSHYMFPGKATAWLLSNAKLNLQDVDRIAFAWDASLYPKSMFLSYARQYLKYRLTSSKAYRYPSPFSDINNKMYAMETLFRFNSSNLKTLIRDGLRNVGLPGEIPPIEFLPHHHCHAYSSYFCSGFDRAIILSIDGSGEDKCTQIFIAEGEHIREYKSFHIPHSLGWFYAAMTAYMGLIPYRDEGKLMGLAALGENRSANNPWVERLKKIVRIGPGWYEIDPSFTKFGGHYYHPRFTDSLADYISSFDPEMLPIAYGEKTLKNGHKVNKYLLDKFIDLAWATQDILEQAVLSLVKPVLDETGIENLCLAGGVAMNCKMNGFLLKNTTIEQIFVQPASSDDGSCIGAAQIVAKNLGDDIKSPLRHTQYGPSFSNEEVLKTLKQCKIKYRHVDDIASETANLLVEGKIVGWHQGPMEFGARALGGRSILANPANSDVKDQVNKHVKNRESWRPFCPSLTIEVAQKYLSPGCNTPFMIVAQDAKKLMSEKTPAVVHVDNTVRPQIVTKEVLPKYHALITSFGKKTDHPVILNTSFNVRGEPIVCTPFESLRCFFSSGIDILAMEDFIIDKNDL